MRLAVIAGIFSVCALVSLSLHAQQVSQEELDGCAVLDSDREKLRCFIALTNRNRSEQAVSQTDSRSERMEIDAIGDSNVESIEELINASPLADTPPVAIDTSTLGQEQLRENRFEQGQEELSVLATVQEVSEGARGILLFHLNNGQVWRQIESGFFPYPRRQTFEVEITQGVLGEYRMRVEGRGRMLRIRRLE
ncbi:MAG: hypothetical protein GKR91_14695 [Pseudomonadales bacterium]|nr:hypothetical protein [Pseudomonadales bacterium]